MAKQGTARFMNLSQREAVQFISEKSVLTVGTILYVSNQGSDEPDVFYGIGKPLDETPGFNKSTIAAVIGLLDGSLTGPHTHPISDIVNLQATLDTKSNVGHIHDDRYYTETELDVTFGDIQTALDGKAALIHTHAISDVTGLQAVIDDFEARISYLETTLYIPGETDVDEGVMT